MMSNCDRCNAVMHPADAADSLLCGQCLRRPGGQFVRWAHVRTIYEGRDEQRDNLAVEHGARRKGGLSKAMRRMRMQEDWRERA